MRFSSLLSFKKADAQVHIKPDAQVHKTGTLRRLSLVEEVPPVPDVGGNLSLVNNSVSQAGNLSSVSSSSSSSSSAASQMAEHTSISTKNHPMRRRSLPALHLQEERSSVIGSCAMMDNPPVFDNPLRRRGCCNHNYTEQMSGYREEAIRRELKVKRCCSIDDRLV